MAQYYKLIDAATAAETFNLPHRENGYNRYNFFTLYPGTKYAQYADDEVFVKALKEDCHKKIPWTAEREEAIRKSGARYEVVTCRACGGRTRKIDVWLVEVVE